MNVVEPPASTSMKNRTLFITQAILLIVIGIVHLISLEYFLYWQFPLLNRVVHFAGGLWVALSFAWMFGYLTRHASLWTMLLLVLLVGIAWEIFEIAIGMTREPDYALDTTLDLVMDMCGGLVGFFLARSMLQLSTHGEATETHPS